MFTSIAGLPVNERLLTFAGQSTQSTSNAVHVLFPKQPAAAARWPIVVELFGAEGGGNSRENLPTTANARCSLDDLPLCSALTALSLPSAIHPTDNDVRISLIAVKYSRSSQPFFLLPRWSQLLSQLVPRSCLFGRPRL